MYLKKAATTQSIFGTVFRAVHLHGEPLHTRLEVGKFQASTHYHILVQHTKWMKQYNNLNDWTVHKGGLCSSLPPKEGAATEFVFRMSCALFSVELCSQQPEMKCSETIVAVFVDIHKAIFTDHLKASCARETNKMISSKIYFSVALSTKKRLYQETARRRKIVLKHSGHDSEK